MLRLCYGLNRFSVDLDFWLNSELKIEILYKKLVKCLSVYNIIDAKDKFYTLIFEIRDSRFPRSLKIEIRKNKKTLSIERSIAYSKHSNTQVMINTISLRDMAAAKIEDLLSRKEIRDAFDLEFLIKKGVILDISEKTRREVTNIIKNFNKNDYKIKLGSILETPDRKYYISENFKILLMAL